MGLNKKQKKQIDAIRKKILKLRQLLAAAKQQPDDPNDVTRLQMEIAELEAQIKEVESQ